jgi:hypothetical protein
VELGTKNRKEVIALITLGVIGSITTARWFLSSPGPAAPITGQQVIATNTAKPLMRRTASGKFVKATEPRLDPTLDLDLLRQNEQIKYAGTARNIFVAGSMPTPLQDGRARPKKPEPAPVVVVPPPPPIELKFFGFASRPGEPKKIFLSHGEDIFIASEGDIVNRRYRVLKISPAAVDIEDVLNNNRQSIPLTQG